jgi:uncharacterized protein (TIGR02646 family)
MIKLKPRPPVPATLESNKVKEVKRKMTEQVERGEAITSKDFQSHWRNEEVKKTLWEHHDHKCCYCERKRDLKRESDVEHFRPKAAVAEDKDHPGYWWLAYDWENYFFSCKLCNQAYKKEHFPLLPDGKRAYKTEDPLSDEKQVLIHPIDEEPAEFIGFDWQHAKSVLVKAVGLDDHYRGHQTVNELTGINDPVVMRERAEIIPELQGIAQVLIFAKFQNNQPLIKEYSERIKQETSSHKEFAGFRRAFFRAWGLDEYIYNAERIDKTD